MVCKKLVKHNNLLIIVALVGLLLLTVAFAVSTALSAQGSMLRQWILPFIMLFDDSAAPLAAPPSASASSLVNPATSVVTATSAAAPTVSEDSVLLPIERIHWWIYGAVAGLALLTGVLIKRNDAIV